MVECGKDINKLAISLFTVPLFFRGILETGTFRWNCHHLGLKKRARTGESV